MAHIRLKNQFSPGPPPPSPIPASRSTSGIRDIDTFSLAYPENILVDKLLKMPDLIQRLAMSGIDYNLLMSGDNYSIGCLLRSASEFGMFRIIYHGLLVEDLESILANSECVFGSSSVFRKRVGDHREAFVWCRSRQVLQLTHKYRRLSIKMEDLATKLETIAEEIGQIFSANASKRPSQKKIQASESTLSLCKHNHLSFGGLNSSSEHHHETQHHCKHALSLYVPVDKAEFCFHSEQTPSSSFYTCPDTIVVTIGEQLAEWSNGEFKSAYGEVKNKPGEDKASFFFEFKCSPSSLRRNIIYLYDQVVILLIVAILCKFVLFCFYLF